MGSLLVLVESLAAALLLVAMVAAWAARRPNGFARWGGPLAVVVLVAVPAVLTVYGLNFLRNLGTVSVTSFVAAALWTGAFLIGSLVVIASALRAAPPWSVRSLAVACAAAAVLTAITLSNLDVAVKGQLAAVRVEAGAKAMALLPARPAEGRDAAPVYRRAFAALTPSDQLPALLRDRASAWGKYDRTAFDPSDREQREFLEGQQRGLALLREAAALPYCTFDRDWSDETMPLDLPLPELPHLRHAATLLGYDALARATRGDGRGALDNVIAIFGLARHVHYPLLVDLLTSAAIERTGVRALEDVLALAPPKADDLARLNLGAGDPFRQRLRQVFTMEEAWGLAAFHMIATGRARTSPDIQQTIGPDAVGEWLLGSPIYRVFFLEDDLATYRRHLRTMRTLVAQPTPAALEGFDKHEQQLRATRGGGILAGLLIPAAYRCLFAALDGDTNRGLVQLGVAATAYKAKNGKYPEKLAQMVPEFIPEVPVDPYDGRPLRLRPVEGGVVVYSVGRDRDDDGGRPAGEGKEDGDLVFRLR
jgi:hypothetical protein